MEEGFPKIRCDGLSQIGVFTNSFNNATNVIKKITSEPGI